MVCLSLVIVTAGATAQVPPETFVNFEMPPITPVDMSPDGTILAVVNLADGRIELFDLTADTPAHTTSIPVGIDPVSVRFRSDDELWVVNAISDTVNIVDLNTGGVVATLNTDDEPADVVFGGAPQRAFVSCAQDDTVLVFDPADLSAAPIRMEMPDDGPRQMGVSPDGTQIYVSIFESGNHTVIAGGIEDQTVMPFPANVVSHEDSPYGGQNPPRFIEHENEELPGLSINTHIPGYDDPTAPGNMDDPFWMPEGLSPAPPTALTMTDGIFTNHDYQDGQVLPIPGTTRLQGIDWFKYINGEMADISGRVAGWRVTDIGVVVINANSLEMRPWRNLNSINMALAVSPADGRVAVAGTRSHNYIRFEANAKGNFTEPSFFLRDQSRVDPPAYADGSFDIGFRLNPHLPRTVFNEDQPIADRTKSLATPRGLAWNTDGNTLYATGMGSNNLHIIDIDFWHTFNPSFDPQEPTVVPLGEGPTGLVFDDARDRLYVLNRFEGSLSVVDTNSLTELDRVSFFDPTPEIIRRGRRPFYDAHMTSGTGRVSCASCHLDGKSDKMTWDLGAPEGEFKPLGVAGQDYNPGAGLEGLADELEDWHPVKGPMMTQTLQDIIGKEPFHWRGDRLGIEEFNPAFQVLLGSADQLTPEQMADFKGFLATIIFQPNPNRDFDNALPTDLPLPQFKRSGVFGNTGDPMPNGDAIRGLDLFRNAESTTHAGMTCNTCHTLPTGAGTNAMWTGTAWEEIPDGPDGEKHLAMVSNTGFSQKTFKVPQLRSVYEKIGFDRREVDSRQGFGFLHDGTVGDLSRFLAEAHFTVAQSDQDVADLLALLMAFSGSDFPEDADDTPGPPSNDAHAAVGKQVTVDTANDRPQRLDDMVALAEAGAIELVVHWREDGVTRSGILSDSEEILTDAVNEIVDLDTLLGQAGVGTEQTYTALALGTGERIGLDRDLDGLYNYDEVRDLDETRSGIQNPFDPANPDVLGDNQSFEPDGVPDGENDTDGDGASNSEEILNGGNLVDIVGEIADPEDINGDNAIDAVDVQLVINAVLGLPIDFEADVNGDGATDAIDVQLVINAVLGISPS
jgi:DNA-binding beta-propeller fold protein YncE